MEVKTGIHEYVYCSTVCKSQKTKHPIKNKTKNYKYGECLSVQDINHATTSILQTILQLLKRGTQIYQY